MQHGFTNATLRTEPIERPGGGPCFAVHARPVSRRTNVVLLRLGLPVPALYSRPWSFFPRASCQGIVPRPNGKALGKRGMGSATSRGSSTCAKRSPAYLGRLRKRSMRGAGCVRDEVSLVHLVPLFPLQGSSYRAHETNPPEPFLLIALNFDLPRGSGGAKRRCEPGRSRRLVAHGARKHLGAGGAESARARAFCRFPSLFHSCHTPRDSQPQLAEQTEKPPRF